MFIFSTDVNPTVAGIKGMKRYKLYT